MRILVTGAAGGIGRVVCAGLADRGHDIVGLDLVPAPEGVGDPWYTLDCSDADAVAEVFADELVTAVVHLAGRPDEASLPDSLHSHVVATGAVLDAMVEHGVRRIVYASSNHAVGRTPRRDLVGEDARPRPDTFYGVAKVAAEALLQLYADRYGVDAISCRIGSFLPEPETVRHLSTWLSPDDCVRMVAAGLTAPAPGFAVLYGISANTRAWWDLEPGRRLGYQPLDDAEAFAAGLPARPEDEAEAAYLGGPFAAERLYRPALDRG
jgi:uronate dehydrogenase